MDKQYNVDDILAEIKRKKSGRAGEAPRASLPREESVFAEPRQRPGQGAAAYGEETPDREENRFVQREGSAAPKRPARGEAEGRRGASGPSAVAASRAPAGDDPAREDPFDLGKFFGDGADFSALPDREPAARRKAAPAKAAAVLPKAEREPFRLDLSFGDEEGEEDLGKTKLDIPVAAVPRPARGGELDDTRDIPRIGAGRALPGEDEDDEFYLDEENPAGDEIDDYTGPQDIPDIKEDFRRVKSGLVTRFCLTFFLFLGLLYFSAAEYIELPLPAFLSPSEQPRAFLIVSLVLVALAALVCNTVIGGGLLSFFTFRADGDSLAAVSIIAVLIQGVALVMMPEHFSDARIDIYFAMAVLGLVCNTVGKLLVINRISTNFKMVSGPGEKRGVLLVRDREIAQELAQGLNIDFPIMAACCGTGFLKNFLDQSYAPDSTDSVTRILAPIVTAGGLIIAVASYFLAGDIFVALTNFAACMAISAPVSAVFVGNLPLYRASRVLAPMGATLSGFDAVDTFSEVNCVTLEASDLFPESSVQLHNIKMFDKNRIDDAILDAASAVCSCNGTLQGIFMKIIQGNTSMLKKVESLTYEDGMGLSAWVGGKRVLVGTGELMRRHDIDTPSRDYELKYRTGDRELIYLANSGELIAMFVVSYSADEDIARMLENMERKGVAVAVKSTDPNLNGKKIASVFDLPEDMIRVLPAKLHRDFDHVAAPRDAVKAGLACCGAGGFLGGISAAIGVKSAMNLGVLLQIVGVLLGYGMVAFFSLMGGIRQVNVFTVMAFQILWGAGVLLFPNLKRLA